MTVVSNPNDLGEAVRVAGKQLRLTQSQIALAAGVGVRFIVELESGKPTVRLEHVLRVIAVPVSVNLLVAFFAIFTMPT